MVFQWICESYKKSYSFYENVYIIVDIAAVITEVPTEMNIHTVAPQETITGVTGAEIIKDHMKKVQALDKEVDQGK